MTQPPQWPYPPPSPYPHPGHVPPPPPPPDRPSRWWLLLGWVGGVVGWIRLRTHDPRAATRFLVQGIAVSVVLALISGALTVALLLSGGGSDDGTTSAVGRDRDDARAAAEEAMIALSSVQADTAEADVSRILSFATGAFGAEFRGNRAAFIDIVRQNDVHSTAVVDESAVESVEDGRVRVFVAVTSTVRNASTPTGERRPFRMIATMVEVDDRWLVDGVEYVP